MNRFKKNKASIVAAIIIAILGLFTLIGPIVSEYKVSYRDQTFKGTLPRIQLFYDWNIDFGMDVKINKQVQKISYIITQWVLKLDIVP